MRAVVFTGEGDNSVVEVQDRPTPVLGPEDICVQVSFAGLNPADLLQREGKYPRPPERRRTFRASRLPEP